MLNLGLPSETLSGLCEPGHAGGKFPRPDLHERLDRILEQAKPDLVVACYGMNDGIYYPPSAERLEKYQEGIRFLRARAAGAHAGVLHLTPPVFDPVPIQGKTLPAGLAEYPQPYEGYDEVLDQLLDLVGGAEGPGLGRGRRPRPDEGVSGGTATSRIRIFGWPATGCTSMPPATGSSPGKFC